MDMSALGASRAKARPARKNTAFIIEALVLLAFLIASLAVIVELFSASISKANDSLELEHAVIAASNTAEEFAAHPQNAPAQKTESGLRVACEVTPIAQGHGTLYEADITVSDGMKTIYELHTSKYVSEVR